MFGAELLGASVAAPGPEGERVEFAPMARAKTNRLDAECLLIPLQ